MPCPALIAKALDIADPRMKLGCKTVMLTITSAY